MVMTSSNSYDARHRLTGVTASTASGTNHAYGYTLNDRSRRTVTTLPDGSYWQYAYDEAGQLTGAVKYNSSGEAVGSYSYEYDGVGNRWHGHFGTGSRSRWSRQRPTAARAAYSEGDVRPHGSSADLVSYASNLINQYTAVNAAIPAYDADGNMTSYNGWTYTYNGENRLIRAEKEDYKEEYSYDYMGRRYEKKTYTKGLLSFYTWSLSEHYQFVYRGYRLAAEYRNGELLRSYAWHASSDLPAWVEMNGVKYRYVTDGNRNVRQLIGAMGAVAASYEYDGYGRLLSASGVMAEENPLRFSSEYSDTGTGLVYYNYRHYSPELGRWLRRDPIEEQGGLNLYGTGNDLVNRIDRNGLLLIAFDGTDNIPSDRTNVYLMKQNYLLGDVIYTEGVGTYNDSDNAIQKKTRNATGLGVAKAVTETMARMLPRITENECIDVIGFSRGAITAVRFVHNLKSDRRIRNINVNVRFLGLFDPVPGPFLKSEPSTIPDYVANTAIAYSKDETRIDFTPQTYTGKNITRQMFYGGHSDVGGGYSERGLANITLEWMVNQANKAGGETPLFRSAKSDWSSYKKTIGDGFTNRLVKHQETKIYDGEYADLDYRMQPRAPIPNTPFHPYNETFNSRSRFHFDYSVYDDEVYYYYNDNYQKTYSYPSR